MIDDRSLDGIGWARFSDDRRMRYRLTRALTPHEGIAVARVVFVMLNPSTADAFKLDNTVSRCCEFARRWGADIVEVVNLFALRSTDPDALYDGARAAPGQCGDFSHLWRSDVGADSVNDEQILAACTDASRVIAAWGNHGELGDRGEDVRKLLVGRGVKLEALRFTDSGVPMHPLARGKNFIPYETQPQVWA